MSDGITRRDALKHLGAVAGAAIVAPTLVGCDSSSNGGTPDASTPDASPPDAGTADASSADAPPVVGITHIVVVMMENRSYDHFLGSRKLLEGKDGDGLVDGMGQTDKAGTFHDIYHEPMPCVADPPHGWDESRAQFDGGANDGFLKAYQDARGVDVGPHVVGYLTRDDLPVTNALADAYTTCDRWFASVMGPTFPNRWYLHSGQSGGYNYNNLNPSPHWPTIYDRLDAAGVTWKYYYTDLPFLATMGIPGTRMFPVTRFLNTDAPMGTMPQVTVIDPGFSMNDDHPPHHPLAGQQFISSIYTALSTSPLWKNSLMVVTYDEHGGFFDHVAPPKAADDRAADGFDQLGFRVPTMIVGPYVKKNHVSSTVHDHTSVLRHIEKMFDLEPLTMRDAAANDLGDAIDADRLAAGTPDEPIVLPEVMLDPSMLDPLCKMSDFVAVHDIEKMANLGLIPAELDLRPQARQTAVDIAEYLARHGVGGIRKR
jgi:phospholipase C